MITKSIVNTIFLLFFSVTLIQAQNSASATMKVSVTVIEGASLQVSDSSHSFLNHKDCNGGIINFADVTLAHSEGQNVHISQPDEVSLKNNTLQRIASLFK
jgi:hypothetical protein